MAILKSGTESNFGGKYSCQILNQSGWTRVQSEVS